MHPGYGRILDVSSGAAKSYQVTSVNCIPDNHDSLGKTLPNGRRLSLSNEVYYNYEGNVLEGIGVEPDIDVPLTIEDLEADHDRALETAMAV